MTLSAPSALAPQPLHDRTTIVLALRQLLATLVAMSLSGRGYEPLPLIWPDDVVVVFRTLSALCARHKLNARTVVAERRPSPKAALAAITALEAEYARLDPATTLADAEHLRWLHDVYPELLRAWDEAQGHPSDNAEYPL